MCKFCDYKKSEKVLWENERVYVILGRPHHRGHTEVVLKEHCESIRNISEESAKNFFYDAFRVSEILDSVLKPDKINFELLGNWEPHLHWHIIPRFRVDSDFGNPPLIPRKKNDYEKKELTSAEIKALKKKLTEL